MFFVSYPYTACSTRATGRYCPLVTEILGLEQSFSLIQPSILSLGWRLLFSCSPVLKLASNSSCRVNLFWATVKAPGLATAGFGSALGATSHTKKIVSFLLRLSLRAPFYIKIWPCPKVGFLSSGDGAIPGICTPQ